MNKNILYITIAVLAGLLVGFFLFGKSAAPQEVASTAAHTHTETTQMWTCSMHPQIMKTEPGNCPICGMELIPAASGSDGLAAEQFKMSKNAMALANIETTVVGVAQTTAAGVMTLSGKITENAEANAVQASYFDGRIERLEINYEGQQVNKGQLLATIYAPKLVAAQQELITAATLKTSQPALYKAVRNKLKLWKLSEKQIDAIEKSGTVREQFPIYATVSGTVSAVLKAEGDYVTQGQPILKVTNLGTVWVDFDAYEKQIAQFKVDQNIKITTNAYPDKTFDGKISFIDPVLDAQTRTVTVRAVLKNTDQLFKPGMFVKGAIKSNAPSGENTLLIPATAVLWTGERSVVYVKTNPDEPVFEMREVTLGNPAGDAYTILDGLKNGEEIVTNGTFTVDAAAQLQGKKSMMNQTQEKPAGMTMKMQFSEGFQQEFLATIPAYLKLKDALVASAPDQVSAEAKKLKAALQALSTKDLSQMETGHLKQSIAMVDAMSQSTELEKQRASFVILNENLVAIVRNMQHPNQTLFVQKCPMANNNQGALWLSDQKEIRNPYFGDAMLTCGEVIETIN